MDKRGFMLTAIFWLAIAGTFITLGVFYGKAMATGESLEEHFIMKDMASTAETFFARGMTGEYRYTDDLSKYHIALKEDMIEIARIDSQTPEGTVKPDRFLFVPIKDKIIPADITGRDDIVISVTDDGLTLGDEGVARTLPGCTGGNPPVIDTILVHPHFPSEEKGKLTTLMDGEYFLEHDYTHAVFQRMLDKRPKAEATRGKDQFLTAKELADRIDASDHDLIISLRVGQRPDNLLSFVKVSYPLVDPGSKNHGLACSIGTAIGQRFPGSKVLLHPSPSISSPHDGQLLVHLEIGNIDNFDDPLLERSAEVASAIISGIGGAP
ncbi:MAG: hypothetical protein ABIC95_01165 [archaeon]